MMSSKRTTYLYSRGFEPQREKVYFRTCAPTEDLDQPAHSVLDSQGCKVSSSVRRRLWLDCADALADLSLLWAHISEGALSNVVARFYGCGWLKSSILALNLLPQVDKH